MRRHTGRVLSMFCLMALAVAGFLVPHGVGQCSDRIAWATGAAFQRQLGQPVDVFWTNTPLRSAVRGLSQSQQVAILIDRRVDPGQKLDIKLQNTPMELVLQTIAERCQLGLTRLGPVVYLGPQWSAARLKSAAAVFRQAVRRLPSPEQRKYLEVKALAWPDRSD